MQFPTHSLRLAQTPVLCNGIKSDLLNAWPIHLAYRAEIIQATRLGTRENCSSGSVAKLLFGEDECPLLYASPDAITWAPHLPSPLPLQQPQTFLPPQSLVIDACGTSLIFGKLKHFSLD